MKRGTKKLAFLDRFIKQYCCSARNHLEGWSWWKKKNRKDTRRKLKEDLREKIGEIEYDT